MENKKMLKLSLIIFSTILVWGHKSHSEDNSVATVPELLVPALNTSGKFLHPEQGKDLDKLELLLKSAKASEDAIKILKNREAIFLGDSNGVPVATSFEESKRFLSEKRAKVLNVPFLKDMYPTEKEGKVGNMLVKYCVDFNRTMKTQLGIKPKAP